MTKRKTFDVETLRHIVNDVLANMAGDSVSEKQYRKGMMFLLEDVLHEQSRQQRRTLSCRAVLGHSSR